MIMFVIQNKKTFEPDMIFFPFNNKIIIIFFAGVCDVFMIQIQYLRINLMYGWMIRELHKICGQH